VVNRYSPLFLLLAIVTLFAVVTLTGRRAESDTGQVGRFQVASGCYLSTVGEGMIAKDDLYVSRCGVFRIDTVTGQTWIYRERVDTQSVVSDEITGKWEPVD
jgi:hypothetical protein